MTKPCWRTAGLLVLLWGSTPCGEAAPDHGAAALRIVGRHKAVWTAPPGPRELRAVLDRPIGALAYLRQATSSIINIISLLVLIPLLPLFGAIVNGLFGRRFPRWLVSAIGCSTVGIAFVLGAWASVRVFASHGADRMIQEVYSWIAVEGLNISVTFALDALDRRGHHEDRQQKP